MREARLTVRLDIEPGEPFAGTLSLDPDAPGVAFEGWIGFMEALDVLRRRTRQPIEAPGDGAPGSP